jgi:hypothetical protein
MIVVRVSPEYTLNIPDRYRQLLRIGQEVALSTDAQGRLLITPIETIRATLMETFGMWKDRTDLPRDGVEYMDQIRRGERLNQMI